MPDDEPFTREKAIDRFETDRELWTAVAMELLGWRAEPFSSRPQPPEDEDRPSWMGEDGRFSPYFNLEEALRLAEYVGEEHSLEIRLSTVSLDRQRVEVMDRDGRTTLRTFRGSEPVTLVLRAVLHATRLTEPTEW